MASTYQTVRYGSTGSAVRQLQSALNQKGYQLSEDGIFGAKTRAAVRRLSEEERAAGRRGRGQPDMEPSDERGGCAERA